MNEYNAEKERKGGWKKEKSNGMKQEEEDVGLLWCGFIVRHLFDSIAPLFILITRASHQPTTIQFKSSVSIDSFNCRVLVSGRALIRI